MKRDASVLVTCFEPFGGRAVNMSREAVLALPDASGGRAIRKRCLPVVFSRAAEEAAAAARTLGAGAILCVGEAAGRRALTPERTARNLRAARIPDNAGQRPREEPAVPGGPEALLSTLPARAMAAAISEAGLPAALSDDAGLYVCNDLFYGLLYRFRGTEVRCGFIHVPAEGFSPAELARGLLAALGAI